MVRDQPIERREGVSDPRAAIHRRLVSVGNRLRAVTAPIECTQVHHAYGGRQALRGLTATMGPGLVGLLGPNGAGKSTLMRLLATATRLQSGQISVAGHDLSDVTAVRRMIGYLPQDFSLPSLERVQAVVEYAAWARGVHEHECAQAAAEALQATGTVERSRERVRSLSGGYRQRLGIACAIVGKPSLVLLDEPTVGIDPIQRVQIRLLLGRVARSSTVLLATHLLEDLDLPGANVVVINEGRARFQGTVADMERIGGSTSTGQRPLEAGYVAALELNR